MQNERSEILISQFGSASQLQKSENSFSTDLKNDEVLIDVKYSGINFADIMMRLGLYPDAPPKPFIPGYEVSGVISQVGSSVNDFKVGDEVMAGSRFGGYVSKLVVPEWQVVKKPSHLSMEEAAATPVNFITAHLAMNEFGRVRRGDKVLIDCATGGVGVFCLQMAQTLGAECIGLTSTPAKKEFILSYGAKAYTFEEFEKSDENNFNFILNSTGGKKVKDLFKRLDKAGQLTCIGLQATIHNGKTSLPRKLKAVLQTPFYHLIQLMQNSKSVSGFNALKFFDDKRWMINIMKELESSTYKPHVGKVFAASDVTKAHEFIETRQAKGKVLLKWS
ncbi:alcohol dehydrogenase catalytic domain-containing protein [Bacteriovoracaceae bacterium]|nr:alcohol dehydrogenase catalytic domain-containing protein [Bacteriovoracaceae bacterium]